VTSFASADVTIMNNRIISKAMIRSINILEINHDINRVQHHETYDICKSVCVVDPSSISVIILSVTKIIASSENIIIFYVGLLYL